MVRRSKRLQRVQSLAESEERELCRVMGDAQRSLDDQAARLEELETYRQEYAARQSPVDGTISSLRYADFKNFLARLDQAVHAQAELVRASTATRDAHRRRWLEKRQKMESLQRVVDRYRDDEARADERQQQKVLDDLPRHGNPFAET